MQTQIMSILMVHSLQQITDVLDPGRERDFSILYLKNLFVCFFPIRPKLT